MNKTLSVFCFALVFLLVCTAASFARPVTIAVAPFTISSESGFDFLRTGLIDLFSSRLALEGKVVTVDKVEVIKVFENSGIVTDEVAAEKAAALGVDYLLYGTVDESPKRVIIESFLLSTTPQIKIQPFTEKSSKYESADVIMLIVDRISANIKRDVLNITIPTESKIQPVNDSENIYAHPDTYLEEIGVD